MTRADWNPERELAALLDALSEELLAAPDRDVVGSLHGTGEDAQHAIATVRRLIAASDQDPTRPPVPCVAGSVSLGRVPVH
jgi:hypothetical protein